ncbi:MAG: phytoene dehydrogenase-like protein [Chlamydiales bacterium]|jgi:phytoene dehydrogenase-like protein
MPSSERFDTIVIGAGMSGLAAGIRLAMFDQRVLILERHSLWGGLNSFYKRAGRRLDVGLHALTNYMHPRSPGAKGRPLARVLRQLRIPFADLQLGEQSQSAIAFPEARLAFGNDFALLRSEIAQTFPDQLAGLDRLTADIKAYPTLSPSGDARPTRDVLAGYFSDPLLIEMLLLPVCYYGSPTPNDLGWDQFVVLFKSLYEEGFARPRGGVKTILDALRGRYLEVGGELRMRAGVERIQHDGERATGVVLSGGEVLEADCILSSAGAVETRALCELDEAVDRESADTGQLSFVESISILDQSSAALGNPDTIVFFNAAPQLVYDVPAGPIDLRSGVICCPDNYAGQDEDMPGTLRLTLLANPAQWNGFADAEYEAQKVRALTDGMEAITPFASDVRAHTVYTDTFTPRTIEKFTGHPNGAVYGSPNKRFDGRTEVEGLFLCGTDQGYLGIVGTMLSGVAMANQHALAAGGQLR